MRVAAGVVAESVVRRLGPLPRRARLFNTVDMSLSARRAFLSSGVRGGRQADNVVDNVVGGEEVARGGRPRATLAQDRQWYRISNLAGTPEVYIYDEIGYWGTSASEFIAELRAINAPQITLRINSPGGEIFDGLAIMNALRSHPAAVTVRVESLAASIASVIAMGGDRVIMQPYSQLMIHEGSGLCMGDAADMRQMADLLDKQSDNIASVYVGRAGGTPQEWRERMRAETWFTAEEAVEAGLADEVDAPARQGTEPAPEPVTARWDLSVFKHQGRENAPAPILNSATTTVEPEAEPTEPPADEAEPETTPDEPAAEEDTDREQAEPDDNSEPEEPITWASLTAHLCETAPNPWAALVAHLTDTTSSSAATHAHA